MIKSTVFPKRCSFIFFRIKNLKQESFIKPTTKLHRVVKNRSNTLNGEYIAVRLRIIKQKTIGKKAHLVLLKGFMKDI